MGIDHLNWVPSIVCHIRKAEEIGLKRGRCVHCLRTKPKCERGYSTFACSCCCVVLCRKMLRGLPQGLSMKNPVKRSVSEAI